ncbi:MAG: winged helix-turn-helix transcriptional regulator [Candidatus Hodarchaeota archaeon]
MQETKTSHLGINKSKLKSMSPSTIKVLEIFEQEEMITTPQLKELTGYSTRTIRYSLKALLDEGIIKKQLNLNDMRTMEYKLILVSEPVQEETRSMRIKAEKLKSSIQRISHPK